MHASTRVASLAVLLAAAPLWMPAAAAGLPFIVARHQPLVTLIDAVWLEREQSGAGEAMVDLGDRALRISPRSYDVHWRMARAYWWLAHTSQGDARRRDWAQAGLTSARRAVELRPNAVEGHYFEALNMGEYATSVGVTTAVMEGVAGKVEDAARRAYDIDPTYDAGGPMIVLGRFYFMLPWPKRDLQQSARLLEEARDRNPNSMVARVYLAETYRALGEDDLARGELLYVARVGERPLRELANEKLREWYPKSKRS